MLFWLILFALLVLFDISTGASNKSNFDGGIINRSLILPLVLPTVEFACFFGDDVSDFFDDDESDFFDEDDESEEPKEFVDSLDEIGVDIFVAVGVLVLLDAADLLGASTEIDNGVDLKDVDGGMKGEFSGIPIITDTIFSVRTASEFSLTTISGLSGLTMPFFAEKDKDDL